MLGCCQFEFVIFIFVSILIFELDLIFRAGMDDKMCVEAMSTYKLPKSDLLDQCEELNTNETNNFINSYRRLLPAHYADGLSKVCFLCIHFYATVIICLD